MLMYAIGPVLILERRWMHKSTTNGAFSLIAFAYSFDAEKRKVLVFVRYTLVVYIASLARCSSL